MNDLPQEAVTILVPLLSAGAAAAAQDLAERAGARVADLATNIAGRLRKYLSGDTAAAADVERALRRALAEGQVRDDELRTVVNATQVSGKLADSIGSVEVGHSVFVNADIRTQTFNA